MIIGPGVNDVLTVMIGQDLVGLAHMKLADKTIDINTGFIIDSKMVGIDL